METDNTTISVLLAGYAPLGGAIWMLYSDLRKSRENEKAALREGIDIAQASTAETTSLSNVMSSIQRTVKATDVSLKSFDRSMKDGFSDLRKHNASMARAVVKAVTSR